MQQQHIDGIKRANVPLACPSFNDIGASFRCILPLGQPILHHACLHKSRSSRVGVCVHLYHNLPARLCVWLVPVCLWTASLYIYWNEQGSQGSLCRAQARSHARIYRLPRIKAWLRQPSPTVAPERWPTRRQSSAGEDWVSSPGCRLGAPSSPDGDMKGWNDTVSLYVLRNTRRVSSRIWSSKGNLVSYDSYSRLYICLIYTTPYALKQGCFGGGKAVNINSNLKSMYQNMIRGKIP